MQRTILITGASTGIGAETARHLAPGNTILIHYNTSADAAGRVAAAVEARGGKAILLGADLSAEAGCRDLARQVAARTERLDVLVNNAGGMVRRCPVRDYDWPLMEAIFALNTFAPMLLTSLLLPLMDNSEAPVIVNLTSIAMRHGGPTATIYAAAKAAMDSFTRGIAKELAPGVRVNAVAPGVIITPFHDTISTPEQLETWRTASPLKRHGDAKHIASAIAFIIDNDFIDGETIDINGGLFMR